MRHCVATEGACTERAALEAGLWHLARRIEERGGARQLVEGAEP
jgi:hypothetical protein